MVEKERFRASITVNGTYLVRFSANLGFLWTDRPLTDAIRAAAHAGFDAVECHWPYDVPPAEVKAALDETGLPMLGINTVRDTGSGGEMGLAALPGRKDDARATIDQAVRYASEIGAGAVHVMAGNASGDAARDAFLEALAYARQVAPADITILIEPLNRHDAPHYFLRSTDQAVGILDDLGSSGVKLMFDCYHVGRTEGDVITRFKALQSRIGHVQFASVPDRQAPDRGELNYEAIFRAIAGTGWTRPLGAEYRPGDTTEQSLGWMERFRSLG